jgi:hypothetical protein
MYCLVGFHLFGQVTLLFSSVILVDCISESEWLANECDLYTTRDTTRNI